MKRKMLPIFFLIIFIFDIVHPSALNISLLKILVAVAYPDQIYIIKTI